MVSKGVTPFAALLLAALPADADVGDTDLSITLETLGAYGIDEVGPQRLEWRLEPRIAVDLGIWGELVTIGRAEFDSYDRLEPGRPDQFTRGPLNQRLLIGDRAGLQLREAYLQGDAGPVSFTLGKQQTVWGQADGIKVLDVVNPQSFRAFILDDFDVSRIPLWTVKLETRIAGVEVETVWIPDNTYDDLPDPDALFAITAPGFAPPPLPPALLQAQPVRIADPDRPDRLLADSDAGVRLTTFRGGWDLSFLYLYHFQDQPFFDVAQDPGLTTITPRYGRVHLGGVTASRAFGDVVLRTEIGFTGNKPEIVDLAASPSGVAFSDNLSYVIGLDYYGLPKGVISTQFFQDVVLDDPGGLFRSRVDSFVTVTWVGQFLNERLRGEVRWLTNLNDGDGLLRPSLDYELTDVLTVSIGADLFYGDQDGVFGQFRTADRLTFGFTLGL